MERMYRVYDNFTHKWVKDVLLAPNDIVIPKNGILRKFFGLMKLKLGSDYRYTMHKATGITDMNGVTLYEGDICSAKDGEFIGIVTYVPEHCAFYLLDHKNAKFYPLGSDYIELIAIIGNVFENPDLIEQKHPTVHIESTAYQNVEEEQP